MSSILVDIKGNMTPMRPANGRSYTIGELQTVIGSKDVVVINIGNFWLAHNPYGTRGLCYNKIATAWCEAAGIHCDVHGSALLIEKDLWRN